MAKKSIDDLVNAYQQETQAVQTPAQYQNDAMQDNSDPNMVRGMAKDLAYGVAQPFIDVGLGAANLATRGINAITGKNYPTHQYDLASQAPDPVVSKAISLPASFLLPGGALLKGAKGIEGLAKAGALGGGYGALFGASQNPNSDVIGDAAIGTALPLGVKGAIAGVKGLAKKGLSSVLENYEKASQNPNTNVATPQQVQTKLANYEGAPVDIGAALNVPPLKEGYKLMSSVPFSKAPQNMQSVINQTDAVAQKIIDHLYQTHDYGSASDAVLQHIKNNREYQQNIAKGMYDNLAEKAKNRSIDTTNRPNSQAAAKQMLDEYNDIKQKGGYSWLDNGSHLKIVQNIANGASPLGINAATGEPIKAQANFQDLKDLRTFIGKQIGALRNAPADKRDMSAVHSYGKIYDALNNDMGAILKEQHQDLHEQWQAANKHYKDNVVPYTKNRAIDNLLEQTSEPNLFTKLNKPDSDYQTIINHMDPTYQRMLMGLGMGNAVDTNPVTGQLETNAAKLIGGYNKIKDTPIAKQLLDDKDHTRFKQLQILNDAASGYRPSINKPATGYANQPLLVKAAVAIPAALAAIKGAGIIPSIATAISTVGGTNKIANLLANPDLIRAYANPTERNALIGNVLKPKGKIGKTVSAISNAIQNPAGLNYMNSQ